MKKTIRITVEIDGKEVGSIASRDGLDKAQVFELLSLFLGDYFGEKEKKTEKKKIFIPRKLTEEEYGEFVKKVPTNHDIRKHLQSKDQYEYSMPELMMETLGAVMNGDSSKFPLQTKLYGRIHLKLCRVRNKIGGTWESDMITPLTEPKYKVWKKVR